MLWRTLQAHGGTLPPDSRPVFKNTGREKPETLDFVERCAVMWGVEILWLEYDPTAPGKVKRVTGVCLHLYRLKAAP